MDKLVYLAGPITGCTYEGATKWREWVRDQFPLEIQTISPMRGKDHIVVKHQECEDGRVKDSYEDMPLTSSKGINTRDYYDVQRCDMLLINLLGAEKVSIGTVMEIAWARAFDKPIALAMEETGNVHDHPMLKYPCGFVVSTIDEAVQIVISVLGTDMQFK